MTPLEWSSELVTPRPGKHQALSLAERDQLEEERRTRLPGFFARRKAALQKANASSSKF